MLVIFASRFDASAAVLARRWHEHGVRLLTCEDLSRSGWSFDPAAPDSGTFALAGESLPVASIRGVVSLLPTVYPGELPHIVADEREYIAGEMMAFLVAWLTCLPCPMVNPPTPLCLVGPRFYHEQWLAAAVQAGLSIIRSERSAASFTGVSAVRATKQVPKYTRAKVTIAYVGDRTIVVDGEADEAMLAGVARLATLTRAGLLTATFESNDGQLLFAGAVPMVDVSRADVANALLRALGVIG